ncbi:GTP cyclohydrolase 1 type 2/Nif3 [Jimgerdemannia flammicorona]|uniref:GTP cyclohydrolase 1 type 2/Nif3 n=1 Tax=Jimgerdemannia flammicorona TaxID=994334 RepID=A0A433D2W1_9FUNG|nr:GTP cyclohydrolase 1 type 2/Nif3 [Jimgerdemannia flammicorona]
MSEVKLYRACVWPLPSRPSLSTMSILPKVVRAMQRIAPLELSESAWDNVGLLVGSFAPNFNQVGAIVAYHPPIFKAMKRLTTQDTKQAIVLKAIAKGVGIYSPHTAADNTVGGVNHCIITGEYRTVNDWLASGLGQGTCSPILPTKNPPEGQEQSGSGRLFTFQETVSLATVIENVKKLTNLKHIRVATAEKHVSGYISTVGICAGSGSSVLNGVQADLFFTGEMGHHDVLEALNQGTSVILCEHTNTERGYLRAVLMPQLIRMLSNEANSGEGPIEVVCSEVDKDPMVIM